MREQDQAETVETLSKKVHAAAGELSGKIEKVIAVMASMPGRTEAFTTFSVGDDLEKLRFARKGSGWVFLYGDGEKPLTDAPLRIKIASIEAFPRMIQAIRDAHTERLKDIEAANARLDQIIYEMRGDE